MYLYQINIYELNYLYRHKYYIHVVIYDNHLLNYNIYNITIYIYNYLYITIYIYITIFSKLIFNFFFKNCIKMCIFIKSKYIFLIL